MQRIVQLLLENQVFERKKKDIVVTWFCFSALTLLWSRIDKSDRKVQRENKVGPSEKKRSCFRSFIFE